MAKMLYIAKHHPNLTAESFVRAGAKPASVDLPLIPREAILWS
jgi:hypothetical protein